jgi:hypothetical protein
MWSRFCSVCNNRQSVNPHLLFFAQLFSQCC